MPRDLSKYKKKILLLLLSGVALGLSGSPRQHFQIYKNLSRAWKDIDKEELRKLIREFYRNRLVDFKENIDGSSTVILTEGGKKKALKYKIEEMRIQPASSWDGLWRIVIFDIPEKKKKARNALRDKLRELGFQELQKSVFVFPFRCEDEINFIVEFFEIRSHVRYIEAKYITNESELKLKFDLV